MSDLREYWLDKRGRESMSFETKAELLGHRLYRNEDGSVDDWRLESDYHNGPECMVCGLSWCHHCDPEVEPCKGKPAEIFYDPDEVVTVISSRGVERGVLRGNTIHVVKEKP